eukprot:jgi/Ulvmu1/2907/UM147_0005.1
MAVATVKVGVLLCLALVLSALPGLAQPGTAPTRVATAAELRRAVREGASNIVLTNHVDVRSQGSAAGSTALLLALNDITIVGDCEEEPPEELTDSDSGFLPPQERQCLILLDDTFLELRAPTAEAAVANLYLRMELFALARYPDQGIITSNGAALWLSNMTLQGMQSSGPAFNLFNQSRAYISDSTIAGWVDLGGAIATVDDSSSLMFDRCAFIDNGAERSSIVYTSRLAARTPSTIVVRGCSFDSNVGYFYGLGRREYGVLYSDVPLEVATVDKFGVIESASLPLEELDPEGSASVLQEEDSPLLRAAGQPAAPLLQPRGVSPIQTATDANVASGAAPREQQAGPARSGSGGGTSAAYYVFVIACITGMVLVGCVLCSLAVCVLKRYKSGKKKDWLRFYDPPADASVEMGERLEATPGPPAAPLQATAAAAAAYAAAATGEDATLVVPPPNGKTRDLHEPPPSGSRRGLYADASGPTRVAPARAVYDDGPIAALNTVRRLDPYAATYGPTQLTPANASAEEEAPPASSGPALYAEADGPTLIAPPAATGHDGAPPADAVHGQAPLTDFGTDTDLDSQAPTERILLR